jgi:TolB-like protein/DNA-binding winged helix-turn-helix (wHTH) protein/Flp pilus assembly protein TadD
MDGIAKFGSFELDLRTRELWNRGIRVRLRQQSAEILIMLLERPGQVVTRDEIRTRLWPDGTVVEFEHSMNSAVNRLREVLGDSADKPRYVETLPKLGYRFVGALDPPRLPEAGDIPPAEVKPAPRRIGRPPQLGLIALAVILSAGIGIAGWQVLTRRVSARLPGIHSIAVLPLVNLSRDSEQEYFADGMTEALTSNLSQLGTIRVISRTSAMTYKGSARPLPFIARELNVDALVEGSVLRSGERVRIVAQLINSATDTHVWSGTYESDIRDILRLQSEVAQAIVREIRAALSSQQADRLAVRPTVKPEAYEAYLKGMFHLSKGSSEGFRKGIEHLKKATEYDPADPLAYAELALGYAMAGHDGYPEALEGAKTAARKSLELGGPLPEAYAALGMEEMYGDWDISKGGRDLERALELNPNFAEARRNYSWYLRLLDRREEGIEEMKKAAQLDPLSPQIVADLAWQYVAEGRYDAAMAETQKCLEVTPAFPEGLAVAGWVYLQRGQQQEAVAAHQKAADSDADWRWPLGWTYARLGRKAEARAVAAAIEKNPGPMAPWGLAVIYAAAGDKDEAFRWLETGYRTRLSWMPWLSSFAVSSQEMFGNLRSDPRFADLVRRIGVRQGP